MGERELRAKVDSQTAYFKSKIAEGEKLLKSNKLTTDEIAIVKKELDDYRAAIKRLGEII